MPLLSAELCVCRGRHTGRFWRNHSWKTLEERIMSLRSFGDAKGRKGNGKNSTKAKGRIASASLSAVETLELRQLLIASVVPNGGTVTGIQSTPLAPQPGKTFWVNGN